MSSDVPVLFHLKITDGFQTVFFFSLREHCIFQEGVDWYHILLQGVYAIGLISWAASEGLTVSSLICDRWLTRKLAMFKGSVDSLECQIQLA